MLSESPASPLPYYITQPTFSHSGQDSHPTKTPNTGIIDFRTVLDWLLGEASVEAEVISRETFFFPLVTSKNFLNEGELATN